MNDEGMYVALAFHYQVDIPWEENEGVPWEVDEVDLSLSQIKFVNDELEQQEDYSMLKQIYDNICVMIRKACDEKERFL